MKGVERHWYPLTREGDSRKGAGASAAALKKPPPNHPLTGPKLALGGSSDAAARRAARLGVSFRPSTGAVWETYRAERISLV